MGSYRIGNKLITGWSVSTAYAIGDIVYLSGKQYKATAAHTGSQPPSANWTEVLKGNADAIFYTDRNRVRRHYRVFDSKLWYLNANTWTSIKDLQTDNVKLQVQRIPVLFAGGTPTEYTTGTASTGAEKVRKAPADGGAAANVGKVLVPVSQQAVPNFATNEKLFFVGNTKEEMSCPDNALLEAYPNIYECGFTIVDEYTKVSGTANSTRLNDKVQVTNANGQNVEIFATMADVQLWDEFRNKLYAQVAFGQKETNTSATLSTSHNTRNANGIIPSIAVNGGLQILTTPGSISFANTIEPLVDACIQNGVYSGILLAGHDIYGEIQSSIPATGNYWKDNIRIEPMMGSNGQMEFQFTTGAIEVRGVHIKIVPFTMFNDFNQWGIGYANTAVFIPEKMATVKDIKTDSIVTSPPISVLFKKDKYGRVRDENYMTSDGGAALRQSGVCDYELTRRLAEFTVVSPLASECILLQPVTIS